MVKKKGVRFQYEGIYYFKDIKTKDLYDMKTHELKYTPVGDGSGRYSEVVYYDSSDESDSEDELLEQIKQRELEQIATEIDEARVIDDPESDNDDYIPEDKRDAGHIALAKIFSELGMSDSRFTKPVRGIEKETPKKISKADVKREFSK